MLVLTIVVIFIPGLNATVDKEVIIVKGFVTTENDTPISGAIIQIQTTNFSAISAADGSFELAVPYTEKDFPVTAWAAGYFNGGPVSIKPGLQKNIIIELHPHATQDNPDYEWLSSLNQYGEEETRVVLHAI